MDQIKRIAKIEDKKTEQHIKAMKKQIQSYGFGRAEKAFCVICQSWVSSQELVAHVTLHENGK